MWTSLRTLFRPPRGDWDVDIFGDVTPCTICRLGRRRVWGRYLPNHMRIRTWTPFTLFRPPCTDQDMAVFGDIVPSSTWGSGRDTFLDIVLSTMQESVCVHHTETGV